MTEIQIPFNDWSKARLNANRKKATTRNKRYGNIGDTFTVELFGGKLKKYELTHVERVTLGFVRDHFYWQEGCHVEDMFVDIWNEIHPRKKFDDNHKVWLHYFREIENHP
jgi:hypothetical protein